MPRIIQDCGAFIRGIALSEHAVFLRAFFQPRNLNRRQQRETKSRSSPRPLFPSLPSVKGIEGFSLVAAAALNVIRGYPLYHA
jgi:hypothetical protein